jgi:hypothetical protein
VGKGWGFLFTAEGAEKRRGDAEKTEAFCCLSPRSSAFLSAFSAVKKKLLALLRSDPVDEGADEVP